MAKKEAQKPAITDTDEASTPVSGASEQGGEQSPPAPGTSASELPSDGLAPGEPVAAAAPGPEGPSTQDSEVLGGNAETSVPPRPTFGELRAAYAEAPDLLLEARLLRGGPELRAGVVVTSTRWSRFSLRSVFEMSMSHVQALANDPDIEVRPVPSEA